MADAPEDYAAWLGRTEEARDVVTAGPLDRLSATLDRDDPPHADGDAVPPLGHWLFFLPERPPVRHRPRRPPEARRVPAAGASPAAPDVGGEPRHLPRRHPGRRRDRAALDHRLDQGEGGQGEPAGVRHRPPRDRPRRRAARDRRRARHRLSRPRGGAGRREAGDRAGRRLAADAGAGRRAALPVFGAHLQQPPHPLRPRLRHRRSRAIPASSSTAR